MYTSTDLPGFFFLSSDYKGSPGWLQFLALLDLVCEVCWGESHPGPPEG